MILEYMTLMYGKVFEGPNVVHTFKHKKSTFDYATLKYK